MTEADIDHIAGSEGEVPGSAASHHLGQRPAVHRQGLQGVHSDLGNDARPNLAVLPAIEREDQALAPIAQKGSASGQERRYRIDDARRLVASQRILPMEIDDLLLLHNCPTSFSIHRDVVLG
jgi:hypothetical protein